MDNKNDHGRLSRISSRILNRSSHHAYIQRRKMLKDFIYSEIAAVEFGIYEILFAPHFQFPLLLEINHPCIISVTPLFC